MWLVTLDDWCDYRVKIKCFAIFKRCFSNLISKSLPSAFWHSAKTLPSARKKTLGKGAFAVIFLPSAIYRVQKGICRVYSTLGKQGQSGSVFGILKKTLEMQILLEKHYGKLNTGLYWRSYFSFSIRRNRVVLGHFSINVVSFMFPCRKKFGLIYTLKLSQKSNFQPSTMKSDNTHHPTVETDKFSPLL